MSALIPVTVNFTQDRTVKESIHVWPHLVCNTIDFARATRGPAAAGAPAGT